MDVGRAAPNEDYRQLHHALTVLYQTLMGLGTWPAALKAALNALGLPAGLPREPIEALSSADQAKVISVLRELGIV
jgi:4-hydroxy-tetrahydrodipicolinate synthase